jgi:PAS domain S-box-containing protein
MIINQDKAPLKIPLRFVLLIPFVLVIIVTVSVVGTIAFLNGQKAVTDVAHQLSSEVSARIEEHLENNLTLPIRINQINAASMQQGLLNPQNTKEMQNFFLEEVKTYGTISSVYFGNVEGGIVGSGQEGADDSFYIYDTEQLKAGTFNKYAITSTGETMELLSSTPNFDARTRPWYIEANQKETTTWNNIYILFTGQDMAFSVSTPVYDNHHNLLGIASVDIFLSQIEKYLETLNISETGQGFIMDHSGLLVASSTGEKPFVENNGKMERLDARDSQSSMIKYAAEFLRERFGENFDVTNKELFDFEINGERYFLNVSPIDDQYGINWLSVVVIPESDFMAGITATNRSTFLITILALGGAILASIFIAEKIASRISTLNESTRAFTRGEETGLISANSHISEIDELTTSFTEMEQKLRKMLNDLIASSEHNALLYAQVQMELSERKQAEEALRENEKKFRSYVEFAPQGVFVADRNGNYLEVNSAACKITGYSKEELLLMNLIKLVAPESLEIAGDHFNRVVNEGYSSGESAFIHKDGSIRSWIVDSVRLSDDRFLGFVVDITERKQAEEMALASQKLAGIGSLAAGMAHEINSPLQLVTGLSERLTRNLNADQIDKDQFLIDINTINRSGWRIAKIIRALLTYSRQSAPEMAPHSLNDIIEDTLLLTEHQLKSWSNISIEKELASDLPLVYCDSNNITQVIINLLENARDAMLGGGWIKISTACSPENGQVILQVSDSGAGIPAENRSTIFDPFFTTKDVGKGTGLGLSIVQGIVKTHGAEITVESAPGKGAAFTICFPKEPPPMAHSNDVPNSRFN